MSQQSYPTVRPFTYVRIPCEDGESVEEQRFTGHSEEALRAELTAFFRHRLLSDSQRASMAAHLIAKSQEHLAKAGRNMKEGDVAKVDPAQQRQLIDTFLDQCSFEIVPVTMPMRSTQFIGTSLYIDDGGAFKDLPLNARASRIAQREIRGDAFMLANHDDPALDEWGRVDCDLDAYHQLHQNPPKSSYDTGNQSQMTQTAMLREAETKKISSDDARRAAEQKEAGNKLVAAQDWSGAAAAYTTAIELTDGRRDLLPNEAEVTAVHTASLLNRSLCLWKAAQFAGAAKDAQRVLQADASSVKAQYRLSQALIGLREYDAARAAIAEFARLGGAASDTQAMLTAVQDGEKSYKETQKKQFARMFS